MATPLQVLQGFEWLLSFLPSPGLLRRPLPFSLLHPREGFDGGVAPGFGGSFAFAGAVVVIELEQFHCALANPDRLTVSTNVNHSS
jgi:hypothetical protein